MSLLFVLLGLTLIIGQGILSHREGAFFNNSVVNEEGHKFLSFSRHGAMYVDALILLPVMYFCMQYANQWNMKSIVINTGIMTTAAFIMNLVVYPKMATPGCHYDQNMKITKAGVLHMLFMAQMLTILGLFYLSTPMVDTYEAMWICLAVCISLPFQTIVPDLAVKGKVDLLGAIQLLPLWGLMALCHYNLTKLHWIQL